MNEKRIRVNVGGVIYETTKETLASSYGGASYFSICLSENNKEEIFVDRNGQLFQYILDYLRTGSIVSIPEKIHILRGLILEADFYLLEPLSNALTRKLEQIIIEKNIGNFTTSNLLFSKKEEPELINDQLFHNQTNNLFDSKNPNQLCKKCSHYYLKTHKNSTNQIPIFSLNEDF
ncbi:potassium channel tetramerization domain-containing protein [Cryptosporidium andersoni]|uniref:Potassium channel tetramerization domain-containing protein n=1 Tax=Cryptosporidium andersoni TaxID=117008 RepID=A0A1J4MRX1_9CRYT|nr:potassium channel tetramerization domain-containing protein [Cryptosporidium andersoni]